MSQAKVDYHKEQKKNRKQTVKRERVAGRAWAVAIAVVAIGFVGFIGYSLYGVVSDAQEKAAAENVVSNDIDLSPISDYQSGLTASDSSEE